MKQKHNSFECPKCKIHWQEYEYLGTHQVFNSFAFKNFKDPEIKVCNICMDEKKEYETKRETV